MRALLAVLAVFALAACGEREQVVVYKQGKYQGKPDNRSWDNAPLAAEWRGGQWKQNDRASWRCLMLSSQLAQNEYKRIYR
jgi:hypothetical protein